MRKPLRGRVSPLADQVSNDEARIVQPRTILVKLDTLHKAGLVWLFLCTTDCSLVRTLHKLVLREVCTSLYQARTHKRVSSLLVATYVRARTTYVALDLHAYKYVITKRTCSSVHTSAVQA